MTVLEALELWCRRRGGKTMKGKGPKHERETIVIFNEEEQTTSIWTVSEVVYRRLKKAGYIPTQDGERSASFELPTADIRLPRPKRRRILSDQQRREASQRMTAARSAVSCSRDQLN